MGVEIAGGAPDPLSEPLSAGPLRGRAATSLDKHLGIVTVGQLMRHYPRRYQKLGEVTPLHDLPVGEDVTILAIVARTQLRQVRQVRGRPSQLLNVIVTDGTHELEMTFFSPYKIMGQMRPGRRGLFSGKVTTFRNHKQLTHPRFEFLDDDVEGEDVALRPIPLYPATAKLDSSAIRRSVGIVLDVLPEVPDPLPVEIRARHGLMSLNEALHAVHRPQTEQQAYAALARLRFEEAFVLQVALARRREAERARNAVPRPGRPGGLLETFDARLPFELTKGQQAVGEEIADDLAGAHPMQRLLQGEVGSGKTVVALRAMLTVVDSGAQAALLAPTEVLAQQHHRSMSAMLGDLALGGMLGGDERATRVVLLTGSMTTAQRRQALLDVVSGDAGIVVGTHALLEDKVTFRDLGLVVVDEQHRFGVEQRDRLRAKSAATPHLLVMTATPIPRTVAMTVFGDLETSTLTELPAGRSPIASHVVPGEKPAWYERVWTRLAEEVRAGHQAYVVCPRIGDDDPDDGLEELSADVDERAPDGDDPQRRPMRAVVPTLAELRAKPALAGLRIEMLHGRLPSDQRDAVMAAFAAGEVDVLVATTVIEVGVDVPNATAMVILDAERFGVSQLHQLRGRVGRGSAAGVCLLVTDASEGTPALERLTAVASTLDGFELARVDLEQRREGDILGKQQSGGSSLRLLRVVRDEKTIERARHEAAALVAADPELVGHPVLLDALYTYLDSEKEEFLEKG